MVKSFSIFIYWNFEYAFRLGLKEVHNPYNHFLVYKGNFAYNYENSQNAYSKYIDFGLMKSEMRLSKIFNSQNAYSK